MRHLASFVLGLALVAISMNDVFAGEACANGACPAPVACAGGSCPAPVCNSGSCGSSCDSNGCGPRRTWRIFGSRRGCRSCR